MIWMLVNDPDESDNIDSFSHGKYVIMGTLHEILQRTGRVGCS